MIDRGMLFAAARHAFGLYRWYSAPDAGQREAIGKAADYLENGQPGAFATDRRGLAVHAWLDAGGERPPIRAALALIGSAAG